MSTIIKIEDKVLDGQFNGPVVVQLSTQMEVTGLDALIEFQAAMQAQVTAATQQANASATSASQACQCASDAETHKLGAQAAQAAAELARDDAEEISGLSTVAEAVDLALSERALYARNEANMEEMRALNNEQHAASGFVHMGRSIKTGAPSIRVPINEGLFTTQATSNSLGMGCNSNQAYSVGDSKVSHPKLHIAGFVTKIDRLNSQGGDYTPKAYIKFPEAEAGTRVYDSATGESIDYRYDVDPKYGDVAGTRNEAVARAWEGHIKNGDFRSGTIQWASTSNCATLSLADGSLRLTKVNTNSTWELYQIIPVISGEVYDLEVLYSADAPKSIGLSFWDESQGNSVSVVTNLFADTTIRKGGLSVTVPEGCTSLRLNILGESTLTWVDTIVHSVSIRKSSQEVVTDRVDLAGFEGLLERVTVDNPFVYPNGLIQSQATTMDGIATTSSARPDSYYAVYDGDTTSRGKGVNFFTATMAEQDVMLTNPWNHLYNLGLDSEGKSIIVQWRVRQRTIAGAVNGDLAWIDVVKAEAADPGRIMAVNKAGLAVRIMPQGKRNTPAGVKSSSLSTDLTHWYGTPRHPGANMPDLPSLDTLQGVWVSSNSEINGSGYNGECYFLPICTVSRLNQGAYHPNLNPVGARRWNEKGNYANRDWNFPSMDFAGWGYTKKDAFLLSSGNNAEGEDFGAFENSGFVDSTNSGRQDDRFYDAIYASGLGGVDDLRLSTWGVTDSDYARAKQGLIAGTYRGAEKQKVTKPFALPTPNSSSDTGVKAYISFPVGTLDDVDLKARTDVGESRHEAVGWLVDSAGNVFGLDGKFSSTSDYVYLLSKYGTSPAGLDISGNVHILTVNEAPTTISGEILVTEVIGDPANILQCDVLKDGWLGVWNSAIPDGTKTWSDISATRENLSGPQLTKVYTDNNGESWTEATQAFDSVTNAPSSGDIVDANRVEIRYYTAFARQVEDCDNSPVQDGEAGIGSVSALSDYRAARGAVLGEGLTGKTLKSSGLRDYGTHTLLDYGMEPGSKILVSHSAYQPTHSTLSLTAPTNNSPGVKFLDTRSVVSDQAYLDLHFMELAHDGTDWGDSGKVEIADGTSTYTNDNGDTLLCGTKRLVKPIGWIHNKV